MPNSDNFVNYSALEGHPSKIQPFILQSALFNLSITKSITRSSGTKIIKLVKIWIITWIRLS